MGTEETIGMPVLALAKQVQIHIAKLRREAIGVMMNMFVVLVITPDQPIVVRKHRRVPLPLEKVGAIDTLHFMPALGNAYLFGMGQEDPDHNLVILFMPSQYFEGIMMARFDNTF
jgi:hypothetical protein